MKHPPRYMTIGEATEYLRVSEAEIFALAQRGEIRFLPTKDAKRFALENLQDFQLRRRQTTNAKHPRKEESQ